MLLVNSKGVRHRHVALPLLCKKYREVVSVAEIAFQLRVTNLTPKTVVVSDRIFNGKSTQLVRFKTRKQLESALISERKGIIKIEGHYLL